MSNIEVVCSPFDKSLAVPHSKSYTNRLLILASISKTPITINNIPDSSDVETMLSCLEKIGLVMKRENSSVTITNSFPECELSGKDTISLKSGDGGTTNRFLLALLAKGKRSYRLYPTARILARPFEELLDALKNLGARINATSDFFEVQGPLHLPTDIKIDSRRSTQFASALFLALSDLNINVVPKNLSASEKYFELSKELVQLFKKGQTNFIVPPDFSSLSYPLALALVMGKVVIKNCFKRDNLQADAKFLDFIEQMGGRPSWTKDGLFLERPPVLRSIEIDCAGTPDIVPTIAFLCAYAKGESKLKGLKTLKYKESDRIEELTHLLRTFKVKHIYDEKKDILSIRGESPLAPAFDYNTPDDHRIVMTTYLFMRKNSGGKIQNAEHVNKSFPNFFEIMK